VQIHEGLALQLPLARPGPPRDPLFARAALGGGAIASYALGEEHYRAEVMDAARQVAGGRRRGQRGQRGHAIGGAARADRGRALS
jgi:hypothetical protein